MMLDNQLKLKRKFVYNLYAELIKYLNDKNKTINYVLDGNRNVGDASTSINLKMNNIVRIGVYDVKNSLFHNHEIVDDNLFVRGLVSIYHEKQHVYQQQMDYLKCNRQLDSVYLAVNHIACSESHFGYYIYNYKYNPREIDAEHSGVADAHLYLSNAFGESVADDLILDYVNARYKESTYFITPLDGNAFESIEEIDDAFETAFEFSKHRNLMYMIRYKNQDAVMSALCDDGWDGIRDKFFDEKVSENKDKMIASIALYLKPSCIELCPILKDIDLSSKNIFDIDKYPDVSDRTKSLLNDKKISYSQRRLPDISDIVTEEYVDEYEK